MLKRNISRVMMIQHNIGDSRKSFVTRDRHRGKRGSLPELHINRDESFHAALHENLRVAVEEFGIVPVNHCEKEEILGAQVLLDAADNHRPVSVANFFDDQADGVGSLLAEGLREEVRPVIEFTGGGEDAILSALRDGARRRRIIEYGRDGPRRQSYVIRHSFQSYGGRVFRAWVSIFRHGDVRLLHLSGQRGKLYPGCHFRARSVRSNCTAQNRFYIYRFAANTKEISAHPRLWALMGQRH